MSVLRTCNLGDSGFKVFRKHVKEGEKDGSYFCVYESMEQQHEPNKPFQLGKQNGR